MPVVEQAGIFAAVQFSGTGRIAAPSTPEPNCIDIEARATPPPAPPYGTIRIYLDAQSGMLIALGSDGSRQVLAMLV